MCIIKNKEYKLFSTDPSGNRVDTGKKITLQNGVDYRDAVKEVFKLYNFVNYINYYGITPSGDNYIIDYNYGEVGRKETWFLQKIKI